MKRVIGVIFTGFVLLAIVFAGCAKTVAPIELKFSTQFVSNHPYNTIASDPWMEKIEKETNGRVKFTPYYAEALIPQSGSVPQFVAGVADVAYVTSFSQLSGFPIQLAMQNFFFGAHYLETDILETIYRVLIETEEKFPEFAAEWSFGKTLAVGVNAPNNIHSKRAVRKLDDLKGLRMKPTGNFVKATLEELGVNLVSVGFGDLYSSLEKNIVEAHYHPDEVLETYAFWELEPYTTNMHLYDCPSGRLMFNWDSWNSLPDDIKKIIDDSIDELSADYILAMDVACEEARDFALSKGHEFIELPPEDLATFFELAQQESLASAEALNALGVRGTEMMEFINERLEYYAGRK